MSLHLPSSVNISSDSFVSIKCKSQNFIGNSNDLTQSGSGDGRWDQKAGFISVSKTATDPFGVANNANVLVGGLASSLILRQDIGGAGLNDGTHLVVSGWAKRVSGNGNLMFDVSDGSTPATRNFDFPLNNTWYQFALTCQAGSGSDWLDLNFPGVSGSDTTIHLFELQLNQGFLPYIYTDNTTDSIIDLDEVERTVSLNQVSRALS